MRALVVLPLLAWVPGAPPPVFEPLGVCAIDESRASCWDLKGAPLPDLTAQVDRYARKAPQPLSFVYGRKTRFLVVSQGEYRSLSFRASGASVTNLMLSLEGSPYLSLLRIAAPPEATTQTIVAVVGTNQGESVELPMREGAKAVVDGVRIELGPVAKGNAPAQFRRWSPRVYFEGPTWRFLVERSETPLAGGLHFVALGHDGKPISYVDPNGKPIPPEKGAALAKEAFGPKRDWTRAASVGYAQVSTSMMNPSDPVLWCVMNIDPKAVARLRVQRIVSHDETLGPLPLDPVP